MVDAWRRSPVIGTLLWTAFGFAVWANRQALNTDNWVDTSTALLEDDDIRTAVGLFIIDRLYQSDAVEARLAEVLPPRLAPLAKPGAAGLKEVAQRNAGRVLGTSAALQAWETANRTAQTRCSASSKATQRAATCRFSWEASSSRWQPRQAFPRSRREAAAERLLAPGRER